MKNAAYIAIVHDIVGRCFAALDNGDTDAARAMVDTLRDVVDGMGPTCGNIPARYTWHKVRAVVRAWGTDYITDGILEDIGYILVSGVADARAAAFMRGCLYYMWKEGDYLW